MKGLADSGFFVDYSSTYNISNEKFRPRFSDNEATVHGIINYPAAMKNLFKFMNLTSGVHAQCIAEARSQGKDGSQCIFAQHVSSHIQTPLFAIQVSWK